MPDATRCAQPRGHPVCAPMRPPSVHSHEATHPRGHLVCTPMRPHTHEATWCAHPCSILRACLLAPRQKTPYAMLCFGLALTRAFTSHLCCFSGKRRQIFSSRIMFPTNQGQTCSFDSHDITHHKPSSHEKAFPILFPGCPQSPQGLSCLPLFNHSCKFSIWGMEAEGSRIQGQSVSTT